MSLDTEDIWREYSMHLRAFLISRVSNPDDAEDLLQDILLKVHQKLPSLKSADKLKPWLFQIAQNRIMDFYRDKQKAQGIGQEKLWYENMDEGDHHALEACVTPFIKGLTPDNQNLLTAIELEGQSQKDYAREADVPYSTLKSRVKKAREHLRKTFEDCCLLRLDAQGHIIEATPKSGQCNSC